MVVDLSNNKSLVESGINAVTANGSTNICLGLLKAKDVVTGAGHHTVSNTLRIVVLLSDGQNMYTGDSYDGHGQPPEDCRPPTPAADDSSIGTSCLSSARPKQRVLDSETMAMADELRAAGVEVYVVGYSVCGANSHGDPNPSQGKTQSYCAGIGNSNGDSIGNRRLLKCIASSTTGTNDHYFEVSSESQLPAMFQNIARLIGFRLIK
jgi:hypothetical protein